jgi:hypothetical protein
LVNLGQQYDDDDDDANNKHFADITTDSVYDTQQTHSFLLSKNTEYSQFLVTVKFCVY